MGVSQKMTQDDKGGGGGLEHPKKTWRNLWTAPKSGYEILITKNHQSIIDYKLPENCNFSIFGGREQLGFVI